MRYAVFLARAMTLSIAALMVVALGCAAPVSPAASTSDAKSAGASPAATTTAGANAAAGTNTAGANTAGTNTAATARADTESRTATNTIATRPTDTDARAASPVAKPAPAHPADIRGVVTHIAGNEIRVEASPDERRGAKAVVTLTAATEIVDASGKKAAAAIRKGQTVQVWFGGAVAQSYPLQAEAARLVIE